MTNEQQPVAKRKRPLGLYIFAVGAVIAAIGIILFFTGAKQAYVEQETKARTNELDAGPFVRVSPVNYTTGESNLHLEGDAMPYASTVLYAKIGGYLKSINVDKGDHVRQGQVLATIESPETDRQYLAALADAKNKEGIAKANNELVKKGLISTLAAAQSASDAEVSKENLAAIEIQKGYEVIRAPFDGTITARYADPGALIQNAINQETTTLPIVTIGQVDRLRVDVYLDQRFAPFIHVGDSVDISVPERPGETFSATVTRFSDQLDPQTRMRLIEIEVPNKEGKIVAWSTVDVDLRVKVPVRMEVPTGALVVRRDHYFVPVLDTQNKVTFKEVHIGDNNGKTVQIIDGLTGTETVALNLSMSVADGSRVRPVDSREKKPL